MFLWIGKGPGVFLCLLLTMLAVMIVWLSVRFWEPLQLAMEELVKPMGNCCWSLDGYSALYCLGLGVGELGNGFWCRLGRFLSGVKLMVFWDETCPHSTLGVCDRAVDDLTRWRCLLGLPRKGFYCFEFRPSQVCAFCLRASLSSVGFGKNIAHRNHFVITPLPLWWCWVGGLKIYRCFSGFIVSQRKVPSWIRMYVVFRVFKLFAMGTTP